MVTNRERFPELSAQYQNNTQFQNALSQFRRRRDRESIRVRNGRRPRGGNNRSQARRIVPPVPPQVGDDVDDAHVVS